MEILGWIILSSQLIFIFIIAVYFFSNLSGRWEGKGKVATDSRKELAAMKEMRAIKLTEPLSETTRPKKTSQIIGQESALMALRAAICSPNPQHVIIYGPPGVGKTAAARVMLAEAAKSEHSPFKMSSPFIELDATILQFDERSIADPLIGCVHDPIYSGADIYGQAGIPSPRPGAVTKAHGGILFIDEIGELNNLQFNKLLKVLEDRKVMVSSSYYSRSNKNIPKHIHDIFENGLPADFRLIGATTKEPSDIPEALRSRCREIYFKPLGKLDLEKIADNALSKSGLGYEASVASSVACYAQNGRDAVNMIANAASIALTTNAKQITDWHIEAMMEQGTYEFAQDIVELDERPEVGSVLVPVTMRARGIGLIAEIEVVAFKTKGNGKLIVNGIAQTEELEDKSKKLIAKAKTLSSVENALSALKNIHKIEIEKYDIHINFGTHTIVDGSSAGCAVFCAVYSAIHNVKIAADMVISGEMSISGRVFPVGQIKQKIEAAGEYGADTIIIPKANTLTVSMSKCLSESVQILRVSNSKELIREVFGEKVEMASTNFRIIVK